MNKTLRYSLLLLSAITLINFGSSFAFNIVGRTFEFSPFLRLAMMFCASLVSAFVITFIIISTAPVLKNFLTTYRQLLRLDTLSHPLLLKLQKEAPATFQHSLQVASLANKAAKAIGVDAFLTRIGAYYHDIGKLKDPDFYIENRREGQDHDVTDPREVAYLIHSHVENGIRLAREYKLPDEVVAFIPQHHGTLLVSYLFEKAKSLNVSVKKQDFRYKGPKPLSKETAIVMLADAIESRLRTVKELTAREITHIVESTITSRLDEKQLDLSGLTKSDCTKLRLAFIESAQTVYHQRIKYPDKKE